MAPKASRKNGNREEKVEEAGGQQSKRRKPSVPVPVSRCSPQLFVAVWEKIKGAITEEQRAAVRRTPFGHFVDCPKCPNSATWLEAIRRCYSEEQNGFVLGENLIVQFSAREFSCVLGLRYAGFDVHPKATQSSKTVDKFFGGKVGLVKRDNIIDCVQKEAGRCEPSEFARLYILLVFSVLLYPTSHLYVPPHVVHYVDDLDLIGEYAWGKSVYEFVAGSLKQCAKGKRYMDGCTLGLMLSLQF